MTISNIPFVVSAPEKAYSGYFAAKNPLDALDLFFLIRLNGKRDIAQQYAVVESRADGEYCVCTLEAYRGGTSDDSNYFALPEAK